ncbi:MAG: germination protein, Ger(x)C family [Firmicutes bacterium]|nr:germination protein, Ger(x)C family [Bacillota bacterium]
MFQKHRLAITIITVIGLLLLLRPDGIVVPVEKLEIIAGIGQDMIRNDYGELIYQISISRYIFGQGGNREAAQTQSVEKVSVGDTLPITREKGQLNSDKKFISALEKIVLFGEQAATAGIGPSINLFKVNPLGNDYAWVVVCKGQAADMLKLQIPGFTTSADYLAGLIENLKEYNFFAPDYTIMNMYVRVGAEGRSLVLPYLEIVDGKPQVTGMSLFKQDKMVRKIDMNEVKIMNMLRENNVRGIVEIDKNAFQYTSGYAKSTRKVSCQKKGDKYRFNIDVDCAVEILSNLMFKGMEEEHGEIKDFEQAIQEKYEILCREFIRKMQIEYKVDCLELGRVAAAKYGRGKVKDWDEVVSNSDIEVNIKVKVERFGRWYKLKEE